MDILCAFPGQRYVQLFRIAATGPAESQVKGRSRSRP